MKKTEFKQIIKEEIKRLEESFNAGEILKQLGGNKFIAMTGAKNFAQDKQKKIITFKIGGGAKNGINYIRITLTYLDLYCIEFIKIRGTKITVVEKIDGIYNDQLQNIFTKYTGMNTHL